MSEPNKSELRRATMAEAKAAWEAYPDTEAKPRSIRKVIAAMRKHGIDLSVSTFQRWKDADWTAIRMERAQKLTRQIVEKTAEHDAKVAEPDAVATETAIILAMAEELEKIQADSEIQRKLTRKSMIAQIILSELLIRRGVVLMTVAPEIAVKAIEVLKGPSASTTIVMPPNEQPQPGNGDGAKVVEGRLLEKSSTQIAIEAFQARRREGVAA